MGRGLTTPIVIDCPGEGSEESPIIIKPSSIIPKDFIVRGYKYHIVLRGFDSRYILVERCQNLLIEDTELNRLRMERCSNVAIKNFTCLSRLTLYRCKNVLIEKSFIARLRLFKSSRNRIVDNFIIRMKEVDSKNNQLELNDIKKVQISKSFNYLLSEHSMCCAGIFTGYIFSTFIFFIILIIVEDFELRIILGSIPLSMLGVALVACVVVLVYMSILRPILNRRNKRLIEEERNKLGIGYLPFKKERREKGRQIDQDKDLSKELREKSRKVGLAYKGVFEIDDEIMREFNFQGEGTESNPYIIDSTENLPQEIIIGKSEYFIKIINCNLTSHFLGLFELQNVLVEHCELNYCEVGYGCNIRFLKCDFNDGLRIGRSKHIQVENCIISKVVLDECYSNSLVKCEIEELEIKVSRGNTFQNCKFPKDVLAEEKLNPPKKISYMSKVYMFIAITLIASIIISGFVSGFFISFMIFGIIGIVIFVIMFGMDIYFKRSLKREKFDSKTIYSYPPNKVI
ncbi:MAG: hypothetical protein ACFE75_02595 [Candidatus Hodarchaeota archaeon]